ncbi:AEC family transporter [Tunicatimonas pelagia]|uniref:AEC family transporter n=1 Tax=Tunicatimonas pelagia TaxID=931531 RepID=UPI0026664C5F|nr:AEC family transporter [Tunicatimonas pelagia]WKN43714.1 AEC family transporter [Tunicatimonas pelagia]
MSIALLPVFGVVVIGLGLRRIKFPGDAFWPYSDRLTYFVLFPALLINKLATANLNRPELLPMLGVLCLSIVVISVVVWLVRPLMPGSNASYTSVLQGSIRPNTYIGLAGASTLLGTDGLALLAVALAIVIPLVNVISVLGFARWVPRNSPNIARVVRSILTNPLIVACVVGLLLNFSGIGLPLGLSSITTIMGQAALPMGLLSVGAGLQVRTLGQHWQLLTVSSLLKLVVLPLLAFGLGTFFSVDRLALSVAVLYTCLPCSVSSYTLAAELGGDKTLIAAIITIQTLLAMLSIPLLLEATVL